MARFFLVGLLLSVLNCSEILAQSTFGDSFTANAVRQFQQFVKLPYEKLYLHIDKPYYSAGENIWYSAYLTDGASSVLSPYSRYIYVELINKSDSVLMRYKLVKDSLGLTGNIPLPSDFPAGDYHLRAYSWWMQNSGVDYFFQKSIHVGNGIDKSIQSEIMYINMGDNRIMGDVAFSSNDKPAFSERSIDYKIYEGKKLKRSQRALIDKRGHLQFGFQLNPESKEQNRIEILLNDDRYNYKKEFFLPKNDNSFDCQFFPEGGNLLNNGIRYIAFKAIGQNGYSVDVAGTIYNQQGDSITSFISQHKGMGSFSLLLYNKTPVKYYAKVHEVGKSTVQTFSLPDVQNSGFGITVLQHQGRMAYTVIAADEKQVANQKLYLLVHQRGNLQAILSLTDTLKWKGCLDKNKLLPGIVHFLLLDEKGNALSERIAFVRNIQRNVIAVKPDKNLYETRKQVNLDLSLLNVLDTAAMGRFSISVTDDKTVKIDSLADNICSGLLLTSDLKGFIEDPGYYFHHPNYLINAELDLVMLTHGWTRFDVPSIIRGAKPSTNYFLEQGQSLSGRITNFFGSGAKDAKLIVLETRDNIVRTTEANAKGAFVVDRLSFPDSAKFIVQALSKKGHTTVELQMDKEVFPSVNSMYPFSEASINSTVDDYMNTMAQKFYYEGGERVYHIKEVTVTADKQNQMDEDPLYAGLGDPVKMDRIGKEFAGRSVLDIVNSYPNVMTIGDLISVRGSRKNPTLIIDDVRYPFNDDIVQVLFSINAEDVSSVNLVKGTEAAIMFGKEGGNGVIIVKLKSGSSFYNRTTQSLGLAVVRPLGYYKPKQFYSPKYETEAQIKNSNPDLRTTIYWNPSVILTRKKSSNVSFYTADQPGSYTVTIEGIANDGEPIHYQTKLHVR